MKAIIFILECTASTIGSSLRTFVVNKAFSTFCQSDISVKLCTNMADVY